MNYFLTSLGISLVFICVSTGFAQNHPIYNDSNLLTAEQHIQQMKEGIVLVRLHTNENTIRHYVNYGNYDAAREERIEQAERNRQIFLAFNTAFDFTNAMFFYSNQSEAVKARDFEEVYFLDKEMKPDPTLTVPKGKPIYIVDVGDVYFESFQTHMEGIVVMTNDFSPLRKPFPYHVRKRSGLKILERTDLEMVEKLNEELHSFYNSF